MPEYRILVEQVESAVVYVEAASEGEAREILLESPDDFQRHGKEYVKGVEIFSVDDTAKDNEEEDDE